ncbi:hypothetical protein PIROE2DRAFT_61528 [Piromyces sp. E2]|nr:hypothetical protein PIROE2DRAFT_61528 [Piromyces sp. E2]|eukprot:OUM63014.1 hypothetical protein PIROE2DRAFT_61528 [Piromyces sp. E2]
MALHYLLVNKHLTKLCKIKKENIPSDFDEPHPMDDMIKEELIKFNLEFFNIILTIATRKENTITVNASTFSYANAVSQDDHKKKQVNEEDKKMNYPNLLDLLVNIIIYTQWCKVKLNEGCTTLTERKEWMVNLKEVLTIVNNITSVKTDSLINNKKQDLFVTENGYFLFKNAVYLRGFIPLLEEVNDKEKLLNTCYYKNFEDIASNANDVTNYQIQYLIKLAYDLSDMSKGNLLYSLKENPINHKMKLIFTNSKEETLKITGINVLTGRTSFDSLSTLNHGNGNDNDDDDENMTETIVFTGRNKGNKTPPNEPREERKEPVVEKKSEPVIEKRPEPEPIVPQEPNKNEAKDEQIPEPVEERIISDSNKNNVVPPLKPILDDKDDLDVSLDLKNIIGNTSELPSEQTNNNNYMNDKNLMNIMESMNNQTPNTAFISNSATPSGLFSPFDWSKEYSYPFTNSSSIIPVQNPNKSGTTTDLLNTPKKDTINDKLKDKRNSTPVDFGYKWLQNQNMYSQSSIIFGNNNKHKSYDDSILHMSMSMADHPSIPPGLSVQTKKVPPIFSNSTPSSANSDNFVSADIFNRMDNQSKLKTPSTANSNHNATDGNAERDNIDVISPNGFNLLQPQTQNPPSSILTQPVYQGKTSPTAQSQLPPQPLQTNLPPIQPPLQQSLPPSQPINSSHLNTPVGMTDSPGPNLLNNALFMPPKSQPTSFPPFPNPQLTPQKPNTSSQQPTPSNLQSPLFFQNNASNINSPVTQIFMTNQIPPPLQSLIPANAMNNSPEPLQTTGIKSLPNSSLQNLLFSLPYSSQLFPPGFNPALMQANGQSQPPSQSQMSSLPNNLPNLQPGNLPLNPNLSMPLGMGGQNLGMNNNLFGNNPMGGNFPPNVDPRLIGMPPTPTNLNALNSLLSNPAALQSLASPNPQPPNSMMPPPLNIPPMGMNPNTANPSFPIPPSAPPPPPHQGTSTPDHNGNASGSAVNPLLNLLNSPHTFNSVGNSMFYDGNATTTSSPPTAKPTSSSSS